MSSRYDGDFFGDLCEFYTLFPLDFNPNRDLEHEFKTS